MAEKAIRGEEYDEVVGEAVVVVIINTDTDTNTKTNTHTDITTKGRVVVDMEGMFGVC